METYAWPGNIRELENKIQRAVILSEGALIEPHDLGFDEKTVSQRLVFRSTRTLREAKENVEREMVASALDKQAGNIARAAEELGISRPTLYDIMKRHGLFNGTLHPENANHGNQ
jgi:two-component system NtrC family response regulator